MEKIRFDFEFNKMTATYGSFLVYLFEMDPDAKLDDVSSHYAYKDMQTTRVSVELRHDHAMLMKLKFGAFVVHRPPPKPKEDYEGTFIKNFQYIKNRNNNNPNDYKIIKYKKFYDYESDWINNTWDKDLWEVEEKKKTAEVDKIKLDEQLRSLKEIAQQYISKNIFD